MLFNHRPNKYQGKCGTETSFEQDALADVKRRKRWSSVLEDIPRHEPVVIVDFDTGAEAVEPAEGDEMTNARNGITRRRVLHIVGGGGILGLAGCTSTGNPFSEDAGDATGDRSTVEPRDPPPGPPDTTLELSPGPAGEDSPAVSAETWLYNDTLPGPEIRAMEGDVIGVSMGNRLPADTTIHWHGIPVANEMDGVPNVTQAPVAPGESFDYRFRAEPAGTYFYHSHVGLQLDRGLAGSLVIEELEPHVEYDRQYVIVHDDYLSQAPGLPDGDDHADDGGTGGTSTGGMGTSDDGDGGMGGGMMGETTTDGMSGGGMGGGGTTDGSMGSGDMGGDWMGDDGSMGGMMDGYRPHMRG